MTVARTGAVVVEDKIGGERLVGRAPDDLIARIADFLRVARAEKPPAPARRPIPDAMSRSLSVTTGGRDYRVELTPEIVDLMDHVMDVAGKQAVLGTWRQSGWKLCKPAARLAPSDVAAPIEALVLKADGTYSVTWKDGGASSGRYDIFPDSGDIRMRIDNGGVVPPDFSGQGSFRINPNELTLRNIWFGTRQATRKPDICELTFAKK
jgi:hypothetical protein